MSSMRRNEEKHRVWGDLTDDIEPKSSILDGPEVLKL